MKRNLSLDILKFILALMVVGIHVAIFRSSNQLAHNIVAQGLFRVAVPIFFLINGFFFYQAMENSKTNYWLKRVLILYIFWMLFYSYFWIVPTEQSIKGFFTPFTRLVFGYHHLWYLAGMIPAALMIIFVRCTMPNFIPITIITTFICGVLIQYSGNYQLFNNSSINRVMNSELAHRNFLFLAYPFLALGYLINQRSFHKITATKYAKIATFVGLILLFTESYINHRLLSQTSWDNLGALIIICPSVFILFMKLEIPGQTKKLAVYSSAIYFIHVLVIFVLKEQIGIQGSLLYPLTIIGSIAASWLLVEINKKVKVIL